MLCSYELRMARQCQSRSLERSMTSEAEKKDEDGLLSH
jgi:hypothetical protein